MAGCGLAEVFASSLPQMPEMLGTTAGTRDSGPSSPLTANNLRVPSAFSKFLGRFSAQLDLYHLAPFGCKISRNEIPLASVHKTHHQSRLLIYRKLHLPLCTIITNPQPVNPQSNRPPCLRKDGKIFSTNMFLSPTQDFEANMLTPRG